PTATSPLSLHDALPISQSASVGAARCEPVGHALHGRDVRLPAVEADLSTETAHQWALLSLGSARWSGASGGCGEACVVLDMAGGDRKSTRLNSSHVKNS